MAKTFLNFRGKAEEATSSLPALMVQAERAVLSVFHGDHALRRAGAGEKFWQFREYSAQDRPQDIDWRQSGKTDRVFIRQKERQLPQTALFWCCGHENMNFTSNKNHPTKADSAKILTLALALLMVRGGERVGSLGSSQIGRSETALENLGNRLIEPEDREPLPRLSPARGQKNALLVLAGDFLSHTHEIEMCFDTLAPNAGNACIIQILDPAEIDLPWNGRALFRDPTGAVLEPVPNIGSIREAYKKRMEDHMVKIETITKRNGWNYILHKTDEPIEKTLMDICAVLGHQSSAYMKTD